MPDTNVAPPVLGDVSLADLIDRGGYEASVITTFNSHLPFYEEFVLRRLQYRNCRRNFVLMDAAQCASIWQSESTRPRYAGVDYTLIPMHAQGAFHPKIVFLLGKRKASICVGSHNLTLSGFGVNRELTALTEYSTTDAKHGAFIREVWTELARWLYAESLRCPTELIESALELAQFIPAAEARDAQDPLRFLAQSDQRSSLSTALKESVNFLPCRIVVLGAFFDHQLAFLKHLRELWAQARITVGVDPSTVFLPRLEPISNMMFVDASGELGSSQHHYLHAKALYLEGDDPSEALWLNGSANPSGPGWGFGTPNTEAMILLRGPAARDVAVRTGLLKLCDLPALPKEILADVISRNSVQEPPDEHDTCLLLVGIASEREPDILIDVSSIVTDDPDEEAALGSWSIEIVDAIEHGAPFELLSAVHEAQRLVLHLSAVPTNIRSLILLRNGTIVARILVHHPELLKKRAASSTQRQIRDAIGSLDSSSSDLSTVIAVVSKVIFSESTEQLLSAASTHAHLTGKKEGDPDRVPVRPESLEMPFPASREKRKKARMLAHGDLVELIDALMQKLYVAPLVTVEQRADGTCGPNDGAGEGVDGDPGEPSEPNAANSGLSDMEIANAVNEKSKTLMKRMLNREKAVSDDMRRVSGNRDFDSSAAVKSVILQMTAVLALLRELRRIEKSARWSAKGLCLLDHISLLRLFEQSMMYLFSNDHDMLRYAQSGVESYAELDELYVLLSWLAWVCGFDFRAPVLPRWELGAEEHTSQLHGNGYLTRLMPLVVEANGAEQLWTGIENSIPRSVSARVKAKGWLDRNVGQGEKLLEVLTAPLPELTAPKRNLVEGDLAWIPGLKDHMVVITEINDTSLKLWDFERARGYMSSVVRTHIP
jgi:hypothetical protein